MCELLPVTQRAAVLPRCRAAVLRAAAAALSSAM
jgi:hypothetical protein